MQVQPKRHSIKSVLTRRIFISYQQFENLNGIKNSFKLTKYQFFKSFFYIPNIPSIISFFKGLKSDQNDYFGVKSRVILTFRLIL